MNKEWIKPIVLKGDFVELKPLSESDSDSLKQALMDGNIWKIRVAQVPTPETLEQEIIRRLEAQETGTMMPFTVWDKKGKAIGMTSYSNVDNSNRRTDIGWTWYCNRAQRTPINTESKYLLLSHAFEVLNAIAVGFRVDHLNIKSQKAVERLGAKKEGLIRNYSILEDGNIRDMLFYSIINSEWSNIKAHIEWLMER